MRSVLLLSLLIATSGSLSAATLVVDQVNGPYFTIQSAISAANNGDFVQVTPGTYVEQLDFLGKRITVYGLNGAGTTVVDGGGSGPVVTFASAETRKSVLTGFTIIGGAGSPAGGGIFCSGSSPTLRDLVIDSNSAVDGGGLYVIGGQNGPPRVVGCEFYTNTCSGLGAQIYVDGGADISHCFVQGEFGAASGATAGGGAYLTGSTPADPARVTRCLFLDNTASAMGAGLYHDGEALSLTHTQLTGNATLGTGGGVYVGGIGPGTVADVWNCIIADNHAELRGGGLASETTGTTRVRSCSFAINGSTGGATGFGGGAYVGDGTLRISNSILYFDTTPVGPELAIVPLPGASPVLEVSYSDVAGGPGAVLVGGGTLNWLAGNIDLDPQYNFGAGLRLGTGSPCIDAGDPAYVTTPLERECPTPSFFFLRHEGELRVNTLTPVVRLDMGADEYWDCDFDGTPDYQQSGFPDCNVNGLIDGCEIVLGLITDLDSNGVPDDCQVIGAELCFTGVPNAPCGNYDTDAGAENRVDIGASLNAVGTSSVAANNLTFVARGVPPGVPATFFSGQNTLNVFHDNGVRCVGAPVKRHGVFFSSPVGLLTFNPDLATIGWPVGQARAIQAWYRDNGGPCNRTSNFTNALQFTPTP